MAEWTDERVEALKSLWTEGQSASQIARRLGGVTRSGICGKVHRLGLSTPKEKNHGGPRYRAPKAPPIAIPPELLAPIVPSEPLLIDGAHVTILTVNDRMCRFPYGDPTAPDFFFCGQKVKPGSPYCDFHHAKARVPVKVNGH